MIIAVDIISLATHQDYSTWVAKKPVAGVCINSVKINDFDLICFDRAR